MNFVENLISEYTGGKPKNFQMIAAEIRDGTSSLQIRDQLMEEQGFSRLVAGKMVEDVEKKIKADKINMASGAGFALFGLFSFLLNPASLTSYILMFFGTIQFVGGMKGWRSYRRANRSQSAEAL